MDFCWNKDTEIIGRDNIHRIPETVCAFANSSGGRIICDGFDPLSLSLPKEVPYVIEPPDTIYVPPLAWHKRPASLNGRVYRRIECQNVISGAWAMSVMAGDGLEPSRDDYAVDNVSLRGQCIDAFHRRVTALHGELKDYTRDEFLRRTGVYSGKYLTFAGALMFGDIVKVCARLDYSGGHAEIGAVNIWEACTDILARIASALSDRCALAFREIFINAMLHSDYNSGSEIDIDITSSPIKVSVSNPGTVRGVTRNYRLKKIFSLSGITDSKLHGLEAVRRYMPSFTLEQDILNLRTLAMITLEGRGVLPGPIIL